MHKQDRYGGSGGHGRRFTEAELQEIEKAFNLPKALRFGRPTVAKVPPKAPVKLPPMDDWNAPARAAHVQGSGPSHMNRERQIGAFKEREAARAKATPRRNVQPHELYATGTRPSQHKEWGQQNALAEQLDHLRRAQAGRSSRGNDPLVQRYAKADVRKAARYYDPEHRRQRKLGMAEAGLAGAGLTATGVGGTRAYRDSRELRERVVQSNPNPNSPKLKVKDLPKGAGKGALRLTKTNAALLVGGLGATAGAAVVRQKAEGRRLGIWR